MKIASIRADTQQELIDKVLALNIVHKDKTVPINKQYDLDTERSKNKTKQQEWNAAVKDCISNSTKITLLKFQL